MSHMSGGWLTGCCSKVASGGIIRLGDPTLLHAAFLLKQAAQALSHRSGGRAVMQAEMLKTS